MISSLKNQGGNSSGSLRRRTVLYRRTDQQLGLTTTSHHFVFLSQSVHILLYLVCELNLANSELTMFSSFR